MFCIVKGLEVLGLAKVIDPSGRTWTVEYFNSPESVGREVHHVAVSRVTPKILGANTRIYYNNTANRKWLVGRVLHDDGDSVEVRFANRTDVSLSHEALFVRWKKPIADPVVYLANFITETPQYADARSRFLESYIAQRGAAWGISGLLSSIIELEPHQINIVRRVLNDASQRYLLADEVGLGKTIEAGVIIRQAVLDDPKGHRVVVLAPLSLVRQWRDELIKKFGLKDFLDDSLFVLSHENLSELETMLAGVTLLVIDEAHHLASGSSPQSRLLYSLVSAVAHKVERLLLLSATPVLRNEKGFHRMLHLLDPVVYDLRDETAFRAKITHRQALAEAVASLDPQNVLQLDWVVDELVTKLPHDARLADLVQKLRDQLTSLPSEDDPALNDAVRLLRAHLSETYRLHRRILRNRRKHIKFLTPERKGARLVISQESYLGQLEAAVEAWRSNALASTYGKEGEAAIREYIRIYWMAAVALIEDPSRLRDIYGKRMKVCGYSAKAKDGTFEGELALVESIFALVEVESWRQSRLEVLIEAIQPLLASSIKVVVFCSAVETAEFVFTGLASHFRNAVVRHANSENEDQEALWVRFLSNNEVKVIVCDHAAEEGLNVDVQSELTHLGR